VYTVKTISTEVSRKQKCNIVGNKTKYKTQNAQKQVLWAD